MSYTIDGKKYAAMYGPTTGDKILLADTNLIIQVEKDKISAVIAPGRIHVFEIDTPNIELYSDRVYKQH